LNIIFPPLLTNSTPAEHRSAGVLALCSTKRDRRSDDARTGTSQVSQKEISSRCTPEITISHRSEFLSISETEKETLTRDHGMRFSASGPLAAHNPRSIVSRATTDSVLSRCLIISSEGRKFVDVDGMRFSFCRADREGHTQFRPTIKDPGVLDQGLTLYRGH
jgi:hypothetical protein